MSNTKHRRKASDRFRQALERQYAQAMCLALKDFYYLGYIPEQANPQTLAAAVHEIVCNLESITTQRAAMSLPYQATDRTMRRLINDNDNLRKQNERYRDQVKALSEVVARLQDRLDQGENGGQKRL